MLRTAYIYRYTIGILHWYVVRARWFPCPHCSDQVSEECWSGVACLLRDYLPVPSVLIRPPVGGKNGHCSSGKFSCVLVYPEFVGVIHRSHAQEVSER